jgi:hypothetical protein
MRNRVFLVLLAVAAAAPLLAQKSEMCVAPSQPAEFRVPAHVERMPRLAAMAWLRDTLAREYRFLEFTTEGVERRQVTESRLVIHPRTPIDSTLRIGYASHIIAEAVGTVVRAGDASGRLRTPRDTGVFHLAISFSPPEHLSLKHFSPRMRDVLINDDPRPMYDVLAMNDSTGTLTGRWTSGGIAMAVLKTSAGDVAEFEAGYFCAFPVRPVRKP